MDYYLKYIKYKTKYLALKGGAQYNLIKEDNPIYNFKSCFEYEKYNKAIISLKKQGIISSDNFLYINNINKDKLTPKENEFIRYCRDNIYDNKEVIK